MIPAHKQRDPNKKPGQIVVPVGTPSGKPDVTLEDYIRRKQQHDAFDAVKTERKLNFEQWYPLNKNKIGFNYDAAFIVWQAAQENK